MDVSNKPYGGYEMKKIFKAKYITPDGEILQVEAYEEDDGWCYFAVGCKVSPFYSNQELMRAKLERYIESIQAKMI